MKRGFRLRAEVPKIYTTCDFRFYCRGIRMPDIYDKERGLKISLTDDDYEDYQKGNLSGDFYARRANGSIANRVDIRPLDDDDNDADGEPSSGLDAGSAAVCALMLVFAGGVVVKKCGVVKKLWDRHKAKKAETQTAKQCKAQVDFQKEEDIQMSIETTDTALSTETSEADNAERKMLTPEEVIQEKIKIIVGMAEIADGKKKVSEGIENLSHAVIFDRAALEKLSNPNVLECLNTYLENHPQLVMQSQPMLSSVFGRNLTVDGQYVPLAMSDIERQLKSKAFQEN